MGSGSAKVGVKYFLILKAYFYEYFFKNFVTDCGPMQFLRSRTIKNNDWNIIKQDLFSFNSFKKKNPCWVKKELSASTA